MSRAALTRFCLAAIAALPTATWADSRPRVAAVDTPPETAPPTGATASPSETDEISGEEALANTTERPADELKDEQTKQIEKQAKQIAALEAALSASEQPAVADTGVTATAPRTPRLTPRFDIAAGFFVQSRGLAFEYDVDADGGPPSYPENGLQGFTFAAAVYPLPVEKYDGKLSGIGFAFQVAKSAGSTLVASDETGTGEFDLDHSAYDIAVHYRWPIDRFAIDGAVSYGNWSHTIIDLPESIAIPDTSFGYLSAGAHVDVYPTEHASIGVGAKYLHIMSTGGVTAEDWYGAGSARAIVLDGGVSIPLPRNLFVRGGVEYRKTTIDFYGSGDLSWYWGVGTVIDSSLTGSALLGVEF